MTPADEAGAGGRSGQGLDGTDGAGRVSEPGSLGRDGEVRPGEPAGQVYDWFVRGRTLLEGGNPQAAAELLRHARTREPDSASVLEVLARALFDAHRYGEAGKEFADLVHVSPDDDYARFGLGLSRWREGDLHGAAEQLALAVAMRPDRREYEQALRQVRATLRAKRATEEAPGSSGVE